MPKDSPVMLWQQQNCALTIESRSNLAFRGKLGLGFEASSFIFLSALISPLELDGYKHFSNYFEKKRVHSLLQEVWYKYNYNVQRRRPSYHCVYCVYCVFPKMMMDLFCLLTHADYKIRRSWQRIWYDLYFRTRYLVLQWIHPSIPNTAPKSILIYKRYRYKYFGINEVDSVNKDSRSTSFRNFSIQCHFRGRTGSREEGRRSGGKWFEGECVRAIVNIMRYIIHICCVH